MIDRQDDQIIEFFPLYCEMTNILSLQEDTLVQFQRALERVLNSQPTNISSLFASANESGLLVPNSRQAYDAWRNYIDWIVQQKGADINRKNDSNFYFDVYRISRSEYFPLISPAASGDNCGLYSLLRVLGFELDLGYLESMANEIRIRCDLPFGEPLDSESIFKVVKQIFPSESLTIVTVNMDGYCIEDSSAVTISVDYSNVIVPEGVEAGYSNFLVLINCGEVVHYHYVRKEDSRRANDDEVVKAILLNLGLAII